MTLLLKIFCFCVCGNTMYELHRYRDVGWSQIFLIPVNIAVVSQALSSWPCCLRCRRHTFVASVVEQRYIFILAGLLLNIETAQKIPFLDMRKASSIYYMITLLPQRMLVDILLGIIVDQYSFTHGARSCPTSLGYVFREFDHGVADPTMTIVRFRLPGRVVSFNPVHLFCNISV